MKMLFVMQKEVIEHMAFLDATISYLPQHESVYGIALQDTIKQFLNLFAFPNELSLDCRKQIFSACYILQRFVDGRCLKVLN
jgi:predicted Ser/Thr protein kinase